MVAASSWKIIPPNYRRDNLLRLLDILPILEWHSVGTHHHRYEFHCSTMRYIAMETE
jgi:hypothetical protein